MNSSDIFYSPNKQILPFQVGRIANDYVFGEGDISALLGFGFSYVEHEDHMVDVILANSITMKKILVLPDTVLHVEDGFIGNLWTAHLMVYDRVPNESIVFSNADMSTVVEVTIYR